MRSKSVFLGVILCFGFSIINGQKLQVGSIFSDHMVLQQSSDVPIWGNAAPDAKIFVSSSWGAKNEVITNKAGQWMTSIKSPVAGGPYTVTVADKNNTLTINDVLVGEVWLCSGQSNMEMPLAGWPPNDTIATSKEEISKANNDAIRMFTVSRAFSPLPLDSCKGSWTTCNKNDVGKFSATAYFFGKKLYEELKMPIGLIHSSWGGTPAESWTDQATLAVYPEFATYFNNIKKATEELQQQISWKEKHKKVVVPDVPEEKRWLNLDFNDIECASVQFDDKNWHQIALPQKYENDPEIGELDGAIWFRKQVEIPINWENKELEISLAMIDDMDISYFNGQKIGGIETPGAWQMQRKYVIPANLVKKGTATIAVRVVDHQGGGGIWGDKGLLYLKTKDAIDTNTINLSGLWKCMPVAEYANNVFYCYDAKKADFFSRPKVEQAISAYKPSVLYNAMIKPLIPYKIKGAIWYQGEANIGKAKQYSTLFPEMINCWRKNWNQGDFPFYYVQIAPWEYSGFDNHESGWLREAQRRALSVTNTGMVVTLDIGNIKNIHPSNKKDVGTRLALWALAKDYGKKVRYSGPVFENVEYRGGKAILTFSLDGSGLKINGSENTRFEIAGADNKFFAASCKIENGKLVVWNEKILNPVNVRYAFKNNAEATLFNLEGIPASTFTTEKDFE